MTLWISFQHAAFHHSRIQTNLAVSWDFFRALGIALTGTIKQSYQSLSYSPLQWSLTPLQWSLAIVVVTHHCGGQSHYCGGHSHHCGGHSHHCGGHSHHCGGHSHHCGSHSHHCGGHSPLWWSLNCGGWRGGCVGSVSARSLQTEPTARLWVRVRSTDVYRVISLGKIFTPTRLG